MDIRVQPTMAACKCGWYINTLTRSAALEAANNHNDRVHESQYTIDDERETD